MTTDSDRLEEIKRELYDAERRLSAERSVEFRTASTGSFDAEGFFKKEQIFIKMKWLIFEVEKLRGENKIQKKEIDMGNDIFYPGMSGMLAKQKKEIESLRLEIDGLKAKLEAVKNG